MKRDTLGRSLQPEHVDDLVEEIRCLDLVAVEMKAAGFDLGNVQQPVDQAGQVFGAAADDLDRFGAPRRNTRIAFEQL